MLSRILSKNTCAKCRVCCGFTEEDKWEIPLIFGEFREKTEELLNVKLLPRGHEYVFDMKFNGNEVSYCPAGSEHGCVLGELKPFDCLVWPFRVNSLGEFHVITVSPVCSAVSSQPLSTLAKFIGENNFAELLFKTANEHPDIVKPYIDGYTILAVEKV